jgi:photosystem II stability/assembly factor-like uncharacterized protein
MTPKIAGVILMALTLLSAPVFAGNAPTTAEDKKGEWVKVNKAYRYYRDALALDRPTGNLLCTVWKPGGIHMSVDQGKTFDRVDDAKKTRGCPFSGSAILASPEGGKIVVFSGAWGSTSCYTLDGGKTWTDFADVIDGNTKKISGLDFGAVDWDSGTIVGFQHESYGGPHVYISTDMGKTWGQLNPPPGAELSPWYPMRGKTQKIGAFDYGQSGVGTFGAKELVYSHAGGTWRSEDGGGTWAKISDHHCVGPVQVFKGVGYWLAKEEANGKWFGYILATKDKGKTWQQVGKPINNGESPYMLLPRFGKDDKHIVVAASTGIVESSDGGANWKVVVANYPQKLVPRWVCNSDCFEYDPARDIFYMYFFRDDDKDDTPGCTWKYQRQ